MKTEQQEPERLFPFGEETTTEPPGKSESPGNESTTNEPPRDMRWTLPGRRRDPAEEERLAREKAAEEARQREAAEKAARERAAAVRIENAARLREALEHVVYDVQLEDELSLDKFINQLGWTLLRRILACDGKAPDSIRGRFPFEVRFEARIKFSVFITRDPEQETPLDIVAVVRSPWRNYALKKSTALSRPSVSEISIEDGGPEAGKEGLE